MESFHSFFAAFTVVVVGGVFIVTMVVGCLAWPPCKNDMLSLTFAVSICICNVRAYVHANYKMNVVLC